ncbi:MAG: carboxypeptidase-like regulatory domain-containing protein [Parabacteroides merdae]
MKKVIYFFVCVLICIGFSVKAQVTTSVLSGKIIDDQNEYVIGATVVAVHEPSGTMYGAVTNVDGRYTRSRECVPEDPIKWRFPMSVIKRLFLRISGWN